MRENELKLKLKKLRQEPKASKVVEVIDTINDNQDDFVRIKLVEHGYILSVIYLDKEIRNIFFNFFNQKNIDKDIKNYLEKNIEKEYNLGIGRISELLSSFNNNWKEEVKKNIDDRVKQNIGSLIKIRNGISHGGITSNISKENLIMLTYSVMKLLKKVEKIVT